MSSKRRPLAILSCIVLLFALAPAAAYAAGTTINVYFEGKLMAFEGAKPIAKDGRTLVPFRKLFETLGFDVSWIAAGTGGTAVGTKEGLKIELTIGSAQAKVNGKTVELDVPAQVVGGSTMVPLRFVSENSGYAVDFQSADGVQTIRIGQAGEGSTGDSGDSAGVNEAEPYVVKGRVTDADGRPVAGAEVFADNQLIYNSNLVTTTDANGYYRIELPLMATTWNMGGTVEIDGFTIDLAPAVDQPFAGNTGAIRNFTLETAKPAGELYLYMDLNSFVEGYSEDQVVLTLVPEDGGETIAGYGFNFPGGFGRNDVPVGRYTATAVYAPPGEEPTPLLIRVRNRGEYAASVDFEFSPLVPGVNQAELEVKVP